MSKPLHQRFFEAYVNRRGIRLSFDDLIDVCGDGSSWAVLICNAAAKEAGQVDADGWCQALPDEPMTWTAFVKWMRKQWSDQNA